MKRYKKWLTSGLALSVLGVLVGCGITHQSSSAQGTKVPEKNGLTNSPTTVSSSTKSAYEKWHVSKSQVTWDQKMYNEDRAQHGGSIATVKTVPAKKNRRKFFDSDTGAIIATILKQDTNVPLSTLTVQASRLISPSHWVATQYTVQNNGKCTLGFVYPGLYKVSLIQGFKTVDKAANGTSQLVASGRVLHSEVVAVHSNQSTTIEFKQ